MSASPTTFTVRHGSGLSGAELLVEIRVGGEDVQPHVPHTSNVAVVRWLERIAQLHTDVLGFPRERLLAERRMWFVARHEIDYLAETWCDEELLAATSVRDLERVKSWRDTVIRRRSDDRIVVRAATLWVLVDLDSRRPTRHTPEMCAALTPASIRAR